MNEQEIIYNFLIMPEAQLLGLIDREFKEILNIELAVVEDWIKNKRCVCAEHLNIQSKKFSLSCKHIKKEIEEKIKEKNKKINLKCSVLNLRSLSHSKRFHQRLHTFKV